MQSLLIEIPGSTMWLGLAVSHGLILAALVFAVRSMWAEARDKHEARARAMRYRAERDALSLRQAPPSRPDPGLMRTHSATIALPPAPDALRRRRSA